MQPRRAGRRGVIVVGSAMVDLVTYVSRVPDAGETLFATGFSQGYGGKGANQAAAVALHGAACTMVGCVGDDLFGAGTIADLDGYGVDTTHLTTVAGEVTGTAAILVEPSGENRIALGVGANRRVDAPMVAAALGAFEAGGAGGGEPPAAVVSQLETPQEAAATAFEWARERGATTVLTPGPVADLSPRLTSLCDWLVPNEVELRGVLGLPVDHPVEAALVAAEAFAADLGVCLAVTLGAAGAALVAGRRVELVPAPPVEAADTTGAGDAFAGAFAAALASGAGASVAARRAVAFASDSVTRPGTRSSYRPPPIAAGVGAEPGA